MKSFSGAASEPNWNSSIVKNSTERLAISPAALIQDRDRRHIGQAAAEVQAQRELELLQGFVLSSPQCPDKREIEFLYVHAAALAQFAREAMERLH